MPHNSSISLCGARISLVLRLRTSPELGDGDKVALCPAISGFLMSADSPLNSSKGVPIVSGHTSITSKSFSADD